MSPFVEIRGGDEAVELSPTLYLSAERRVELEEVRVRLTLYSDSGRVSCAELRLEPYTEGAYWVFAWLAGDALVVIGAQRFVFLRLESMEVLAVVPIEVEECERADVPMLVLLDDVLAIVTETRVSCFVDRQYRWTWSTRALYRDWCQTRGVPSIVDGRILVPLRVKDRDVDIEIDTTDGVARVLAAAPAGSSSVT
jgi:hypothetical protein